MPRRGRRNPMNRSLKKRKPKYGIKFSGGMTWSQALNYAVSGVNLLKGLVNVEKHLHNKVHNPSIPSAGTVALISDIAQGDDVADRQGNSILMKYIEFKYTIQINASATATTVRLMLIVDKDNQGSSPSPTDILDFASEVSPLNTDNASRFWVLADKMYALSINGDRVVTDHVFRRCNFHTKYSGANSTDTKANNIYLLTVSNEATNEPTLQGYTRCAFYDN